MIAKFFVGGMLLISLYDSIVLLEANIDNSSIRLPIPTKINNNHMKNSDENTKTHGSRKLIKQPRRVSSSSNRVDIDDFETLDQTLLSFLSQSAFGRQKVIEIMIDQYVSPTTPEDDIADKLDNAMEAISFLETDAEPVQVVGYPFLFVGSVGASLNHKSLHKMGITNVINWSSTARCNVFDDIEYMCIEGVRGGNDMQDHTDKLEKAVDYVESVRLAGGKAMSHCWYGRNRSVTLLVAYLMKYEGMTATEANDLIKKSRPQAGPYWDALQEYSNNYLSSKNNTFVSSGLRTQHNSNTKKKKKKKKERKDEDQS